MRIYISITLLLLLITPNIANSANTIKVSSWDITITSSFNEVKITRWNIFNFYANYYEWQVPESYKYINVRFTDIIKWSELEESLQKLIYLNLIENPKRELFKDSELNAWWFFRLSEKVLWIKINDAESKDSLLNRNTNTNDINAVSGFIWKTIISIDTKSNSREIKQKIAILKDV